MKDGRFRKDCLYIKTCTRPSCYSCVRYEEMSFLTSSSGIPKRYLKPFRLSVPDSDVDATEYRKLQAVKNKITDFVAEGRNLIIYSENTGNGKTSWAISMLLSYFDKIWLGNGLEVRGLFISSSALLQALKDFDNPLSYDYIESIKNADLVIWDDIAVSKLTDYEHSRLLILIEHRINNEKSNIYTTNCVSEKELSDRLGQRLTSRIIYTAMKSRLHGKDKRGMGLDVL